MGLRRLRDDNLVPQQLFDSGDNGGRNIDAATQDAAKLRDDYFTDDEIVLRKDMPQDVRTQAARSKSTYQYIGVEKDPHDTALFTSSSARNPRASAKGRT